MLKSCQTFSQISCKVKVWAIIKNAYEIGVKVWDEKYHNFVVLQRKNTVQVIVYFNTHCRIIRLHSVHCIQCCNRSASFKNLDIACAPIFLIYLPHANKWSHSQALTVQRSFSSAKSDISEAQKTTNGKTNFWYLHNGHSSWRLSCKRSSWSLPNHSPHNQHLYKRRWTKLKWAPTQTKIAL